jgi:hypothetical protein
MIDPRRLWPAFTRVMIALLILSLFGLAVLALNPGTLRGLFYAYIPGMVEIPAFDAIPPEPAIDAPHGDLPSGSVALTGRIERVGLSFGCGFLLELEDGRRVAIATAHAAPAVPPNWPARFYAPDGAVIAHLPRQIDLGQKFVKDHFGMDYSIWAVDQSAAADRYLKPDPRGQAQPGERIVLYSNRNDAAGEEETWAGVVMQVLKDATWIQLDDAIDPRGLSGCPVMSAHTGRVIGMAVAGSGGPPTIIGLNPAGLLVEKAAAAAAAAAALEP